MAKGTRTQKPPTRLPFKTDGPTTGARHEYRHCWALWQPNQTANFPALAITRVSGLTTNPGAKAFAPHLLKTHECRANNAEVTGAGAQRREPKAVRFWRPVDRLVNGRSPPWLSLETQTACPLPDSLHQLDGWRKEPERKGYPPDYRLRRTAPQLGHTMNTNTADHCGNQTRQRIFRPWPSPA